jgi:creatinine amidohydrolase
MLHLAPWNVRVRHAEAGNPGALADLLPQLLSDGVKAVSPNGVLGDPTGASAQEGADLLDAIVREVATEIAGATVP